MLEKIYLIELLNKNRYKIKRELDKCSASQGDNNKKLKLINEMHLIENCKNYVNNI